MTTPAMAKVSFNIADLGGNDVTKVEWLVEVNAENGRVEYASHGWTYYANTTHIFEANGELELPVKVGANPVDFEYKLTPKVTVRNGTRGGDWREPYYFPAPATAVTVNVTTLAATSTVPASWATALTQQITDQVEAAAQSALASTVAAKNQAVVAKGQAEAAKAAAEAAAAAAGDLIVTDLGTTDGQTKALIESGSSQTRTALDAAIADGVRAGAFAAVLDATMEPVGELALEPAPLHANFLPTSVGVDGCVYGAIGAMYLGRTNDASTGHQAGQDFSVYPEHAGPSGAILWVTRTEAGYVVVTGKVTTTYVWFSPTFTGGFTKVLEIPFIGATRLGIPNPQRTLDGKTVLVVSIWAGGSTPSKPAYASFDGGQTWKHLRDTPPFTAGGSNSHWHAAAYHKWTDRLWLSGGDGVNSYFGYTEDRGDTWVDCKTPPGSPIHDEAGGVSIDYQQPTIVIPFRDRIALGPDRGSLPPGMWTMDPVTATTVPHYTLDATVATADRQYPIYPYAQRGVEVYVSYPASTSMPVATRTHTDIVATGDGGRSWHRVLRIPWAGTNADTEGIWGIAGPDKNGWMYLRTITGIKRARTLEWVPSTPDYY